MENNKQELEAMIDWVQVTFHQLNHFGIMNHILQFDRELMEYGNYSVGLRIYCADREKVIQECKNPIAAGDFKWILACICEGTEQIRNMKTGGASATLENGVLVA